MDGALWKLILHLCFFGFRFCDKLWTLRDFGSTTEYVFFVVFDPFEVFCLFVLFGLFSIFV